MPDLATRLRDEIQKVITHDFGDAHGSQIAFAKALWQTGDPPLATLSLFLSGERPGTSRGRREGDDQSLIQKLFWYLKRKCQEAINTAEYDFYFDASMVLYAYTFDDPDFLP